MRIYPCTHLIGCVSGDEHALHARVHAAAYGVDVSLRVPVLSEVSQSRLKKQRQITMQLCIESLIKATKCVFWYQLAEQAGVGVVANRDEGGGRVHLERLPGLHVLALDVGELWLCVEV